MASADATAPAAAAATNRRQARADGPADGFEDEAQRDEAVSPIHLSSRSRSRSWSGSSHWTPRSAARSLSERRVQAGHRGEKQPDAGDVHHRGSLHHRPNGEPQRPWAEWWDTSRPRSRRQQRSLSLIRCGHQHGHERCGLPVSRRASVGHAPARIMPRAACPDTLTRTR